MLSSKLVEANVLSPRRSKCQRCVDSDTGVSAIERLTADIERNFQCEPVTLVDIAEDKQRKKDNGEGCLKDTHANKEVFESLSHQLELGCFHIVKGLDK